MEPLEALTIYAAISSTLAVACSFLSARKTIANSRAIKTVWEGLAFVARCVNKHDLLLNQIAPATVEDENDGKDR